METALNAGRLLYGDGARRSLDKRELRKLKKRTMKLDKLRGPRGGRIQKRFPECDEVLVVTTHQRMIVAGDAAKLVKV